MKLAYNHYCFLQSQLEECDIESEKTIKKMSTLSTSKEVFKIKKSKNNPNFNVSQYLYEALGVEVTKIYGIKEITALSIFSETGVDIKEKFPTEKQFLSWLNVVPNNIITGGKVISSSVRRRKTKSGGKQAVVATARKLAAIYYKIVTEKVEFDPKYLTKDKEAYLKNKLK